MKRRDDASPISPRLDIQKRIFVVSDRAGPYAAKSCIVGLCTKYDLNGNMSLKSVACISLWKGDKESEVMFLLIIFDGSTLQMQDLRSDFKAVVVFIAMSFLLILYVPTCDILCQAYIGI